MKSILKNKVMAKYEVFFLSLLFFLLFFFFSPNSYGAETENVWKGPVSVAPTGNVAPPINVSTSSQVKSGGLSVGSFIVEGRSNFLNNVVIGSNSTTTIEKLEVFGAVKIGNTASVCNAQSLGTLRYNPTARVFQGCHQTGVDTFAWKEVTGGGTYKTLNSGSWATGPINLSCQAGEEIITAQVEFNGYNPSVFNKVSVNYDTETASTDCLGSECRIVALCFAPDGSSSGGSGGGSGGGSLWTQNGSNIFYSTGNVGIGTDTPLKTLQVAGSAVFSGTSADIGVPNGQGLELGTWNPSYTVFTPWINITSSGDVGIGTGTSTPLQKLHVSGYVRADSGLCIGADCRAEWPGGATGNSGWIDDGTVVRLATGSDMVGIGTTNPQYKLSVESAGNSYAQISSTSDNSYAGVIFKTTSGSSSASSVVRMDYSGTLSGGEGRGLQYKSGGVGFGNHWFLNSNDSVQMLIKDNGDVGIGTTNPTQKLDVFGYVRGDTGLCIGNDCRTEWPVSGSSGGWTDSGSTVYLSTITDKVGIGTQTPTTALEVAGTVKAISFVGDGSQLTGIPGSDNLGDHTATQNLDLASYQLVGSGGISGIFINAVGNVGVGTQTPTSKIHAAGYVRGDSGLCIGNDCRSAWPGSGLWTDAGSYIYANNSTSTVITDSGLLGVGTASPSESIHSTGYIRADGGLCISGDCRSSWPVGADNLGDHTATQNLDLANYQLVGNGGSSGIYISSSGNVGIGSTSPASKLMIKGDNTSSGGIRLEGAGATSGANLYYDATSSNFVLEVGSNKALFTDSSGRVGISNSSPNKALDIGPSGTANSTITQAGSKALAFTGSFWNGSAELKKAFTLQNIPSTTVNEKARLALSWADNELFSFLSSGNLGVGTTEPTERIQTPGYVRGDTGLCIGNDCRTAWPASSSASGWQDNGASVTLITPTDDVAVGSNFTPLNTKFYTNYDSTTTQVGSYYASKSRISFSGAFSDATSTTNLYGIDSFAEAMGVSTAGNVNIYGARISANGESTGAATSTAYGLYVSAYGADRNYPAIFTGGNVGVGVTEPLEALHVGGYARADSGLCIGSDCRTQWPQAGLWSRDSTTTQDIYRLSGNVGIGTNSPMYKLDVSGTLNATGATTLGSTLAVTGATTLSSDLTVDTNTLFVDSTNNRVGIGTTSPSSILQLKGTKFNSASSSFTGLTIDSSAVTSGSGNFGTAIEFTKLGNSSFKKASIVPVQTGVDDDRLGLAFFVSSSAVGADPVSEALRIEGVTGNVGIGTTSPAEKLQVAGYVRGDTGLCIGSDCRTSWPNSSLWTDAGSYIYANNSTNTVVTDSGNVGIGTTSPSAKLDVQGSIRIADGTQADGRILTSDANGFASWKPNNAVLEYKRDIPLSGKVTNDYIELYKFERPASLQGVFEIYTLMSGGGYGQTTRYLVPVTFVNDFYDQYGESRFGNAAWVDVKPSLFTGRHQSLDEDDLKLQMRVDANAVSFRLKVGKTLVGSPVAQVSVRHNRNFEGYTITELNGSGNDTTVVDTAPVIFSSPEGVSNFYGDVNIKSSPRKQAKLNLGGDLTVDTNTLFVDSTNNRVGIGTASPSVLLHLKKDGGTLRLSTDNVNLEESSRIQFEEGSSGNGLEFFYDGRAVGSSNGSLRFRDIGTGTDIMSLLRTGNVGIGTTSPGAPLHISNSAATGLKIERSAGSSANSTIEIANATRSMFIGINSSENFAIGTSANLDTNGKMVVTNTGNVGIGTTSPAEKLQVAGYVRGDTGLCIGSDCRTSWPNSSLWTDAGSYIYANNSTSTVITDSGNVGIGITSPTGVFEVNAPEQNFRINSNGGIDLPIYNSSGYATFNIPSGRGFKVTQNYSGSALFALPPSQAGEVLIAYRTLSIGDTSSPGTSIYLSSRGNSDLNLRAGDGSSSRTANILFSTRDSVERMRITSTGNVGIGTTSPSAKLDVAGATKVSGNLTVDTNTLFVDSTNNRVGIGTTSPGAKLQVQGSDGVGRSIMIDNREIKFRGDGVAHMSIFGPDTGKSYLTIQNTSSNSAIGTTGTDLFTILSSGNVGIGTTSPAEKLQVAGYVRGDTGLCIGSDCRTSWPNSSLWTDAGSYIYANNSTNTVVTDSGNVGIGTTSPTEKLTIDNGNIALENIGADPNSVQNGLKITTVDLAGSTGNAGVYLSAPYGGGTANNGFIRVKRGQSNVYNGMEISSSGDFRILTNSTSEDSNERLRITSSGNVGIGTTSPGAKLDVNGDIKISNGASSLIFGSPGSATWGAPKIFRLSSGMIGISDYSGVQLGGYDGVSYGPRLTVLGSGNVGIGTTSPSAKLDVAGATKVSGDLTVDTNTLYVDSTNNRVGIGTTSPGADLDVGGTTQEGALRNVFARMSEGDTVGDGTYLGVRAWATQPNQYGGKAFSLEHSFYGDINSSINFYRGGSTTGGFIRFATNNGTEQVTITNTGSVGIGTTTPSQKLQVAGYVRGDTGLCIGADCRTSWPSGADNLGDHTATQNIRLSGNWLSGDGGNEGVFVSSAGNVGVGTASPSQRLDVSGNANISGNVVVGGNFTVNGLTTTVNSTQVNYKFMQINPETGNTNALIIRSAVDGNSYIGSPIKYYKNLSDANTTMEVKNDGTVYTTGNISAGVASPNEKIQSSGYVRGDTGLCIGADCRTSWPANASGWQDNGTTVTLQSATDNVGIGVANPTNKLDVDGKIQVTAGNDICIANGNCLSALGPGTVDGTGVTNYLSKWSASSTLTNSVIYDDGTNVGIGTTSPSETLHVNNDSSKQIVLTNGGDQKLYIGSIWNTVGTFIGGNNYYSTSWQHTPTNNSASGIYFRNNGSIQLYTDTGLVPGTDYNPTERMTITNTGNVGIGTTSPGNKLSVVGGPIAAFSGIRLGSDASGEGILRDSSNGIAFVTGAFSTANAKMTITNAGNVGIGTTSPTQKLQVAGYVRGDTGLCIGSDCRTSWPNSSLWTDAGSYIYANNSTSTVITDTGNVGIGTTSPGAKLEVVSPLNSSPGGSEGIRIGAGTTQAQIWQRVDGRIAFAPDVTKTTNFIDIMNIGDNLVYEFQASGNAHFRGYGTGIQFETKGTGYGSITFAPNVDTLGVSMTILETSGNVGIGTTSPTHKLDVAGTLNATGATTLGSTLAVTGNTTLSSDLTVDTNTFFVDSTNNRVGIGTSTPSTKLHISDNGNSAILRVERKNATDPAYIQLSNTNGRSYIGYSASYGLLFNDINRSTYSALARNGGWLFGDSSVSDIPGSTVSIKNNLAVGADYWNTAAPSNGAIIQGNVGIGTTSPGAKLDVEGGSGDTAIIIGNSELNNTTDTVSLIFKQGYHMNRAGGRIVSGRDGVYGGSASTKDSNLQFFTAQDDIDVERMRINSSGNVGIGTTSPAEKLQVAGYVRGDTGLCIGADCRTDWPTSGAWTVSGSDVYRASGKVGIGTTSPVATLDVSGGIALEVKTITANYTATASDYMILCDASSGAVTVTLPDATAVAGLEINVKKKDASSNACVIQASGSQTIDGSSSVSIPSQYISYSVISDGTVWWIK